MSRGRRRRQRAAADCDCRRATCSWGPAIADVSDGACGACGARARGPPHMSALAWLRGARASQCSMDASIGASRGAQQQHVAKLRPLDEVASVGMSNLHVRPADHCDLQIAADVGVSMHEDMHEVRVRAIAPAWRAVRRERRSAIEWRTADHAILEGVEQKMRLAQRARASEA